jgi:hypothetical protein
VLETHSRARMHNLHRRIVLLLQPGPLVVHIRDIIHIWDLLLARNFLLVGQTEVGNPACCTCGGRTERGGIGDVRDLSDGLVGGCGGCTRRQRSFTR